jgi:hypothetical protein
MAAPLQQPEKAGPSPADRAVIRNFVAYLEVCGFCRCDSAQKDKVMPFNRLDGQEYSHAYIGDRLNRWLKSTDQQLTFREVAYIVACLPLIKGTKFIPGDRCRHWEDPNTGTLYGNAWRGYVPQGESAEISPLLLELFERLAPVPSERRVLIQWLAHIVQHPWERPSWHIMIPSEPGTGKGFLLEQVLHPLLHHTMVISSFSQLTAQFSPVLESSLLVLLDDCKSKSDSTQTRLKSIMSEERQYVEGKHKTGGMVNSYTRFILASNETRPLILEPGERRWFVLTRAVHRVDLWETQRFIKRLADWLALPGSLDTVYRWLERFDLTGFDPKAVPMSDGLAHMIAMSKSQEQVCTENFIKGHPVFNRPDLHAEMKEQGMRPSTNQLRHLLDGIGYETHHIRLDHFDGKQKYICAPAGWTKDQIEAAFVSLPVAEVPY